MPRANPTRRRDRRSVKETAKRFSQALHAAANEFDGEITISVERHAVRVADLLRARDRTILRALADVIEEELVDARSECRFPSTRSTVQRMRSRMRSWEQG